MIDINIQKELHGSLGKMHLKVNVHIRQGEFIALMGESGSGKTTLLRVLAGLVQSEGEVRVEGISWKHLPVQQREIGFVFQDYALFDNMSVEENLLFVNDDKALACELLEMTALTALKARNVTGLSGGQQQRVALCRAMMKRPKLLLMDEPLSALGEQMRKSIQEEIKTLHERFSMTTIMVSHNASEVFTLASRVLVLNQGDIIQDGVPKVVLQSRSMQSVEVLALTQNAEKTIATLSQYGELLEVEVDAKTQVGDKINIEIKAEQI